MDDRELLELAAKAAGIGPVIGFEAGKLVIGPHTHCRHWNPIADDDEAFRLVNALGLTVGQSFDGAYVDLCCGEILQLMKDGCQYEVKWSKYGGDKNAACRLAVVLCAAKIGKAMP